MDGQKEDFPANHLAAMRILMDIAARVIKKQQAQKTNQQGA